MGLVDAMASLLHVLAAVIWVGGMFFAWVVVVPLLPLLDPPPLRGKLIEAIARRFAPFASGSVAVLVLTGIIRGRGWISSPAALLGTGSGVALLLKIAIALAAIAIAVVAELVIGSRLAAAAASQAGVAAGGQPLAREESPATSAELARLQSLKMALLRTNVSLGMLVLVVSVAMRYL